MRITVVGAGVVGCAIAHELAARGAGVHLLDPRGAAGGATRASAGILAPTIEGHAPALRQLAACSLAMYDRFVRRIEQDAGRPVEYRRIGSVQVSCEPGADPGLAAEARALEQAGIAHTLLDREGVRRALPGVSEAAMSGLLVADHGYAVAAELTQALLSAAVARGAHHSTTAVRGIDARNGIVRVRTDEGPFETDAVVLASGSWPVDLRPDPPPPVTPIRGQLVHLQADAGALPRIVWGPDCYLVPWQDGSVLVGATVEDAGFDERPTAGGVQGLLSAATGLFPALAGAHLREVRVGLRPKSVDELPVIGRAPTMPGVFYALGHYRNGVLLSPLTAALVADLVLEGREGAELALVRPDRAGMS